MEELYFIASLQILYRSQNLTHLQAELYDFEDSRLATAHLNNCQTYSLPIQTSLRNFYLRIIDTDHDISQLFSYFWQEGTAKEGTVDLTESFDNFIIEISIDIKQKKQQQLPQCQAVTEQQVIDPKMHLQRIKQKVFEVLQGQNFFADENSRVKCNFVRKNKTHKNLTALLIKTSTNILKKISQNVNCNAAKTYNQLKTTQTNETADEITIEILPPLDKMKKINSMQDPAPHWQDTDSNSNYATIAADPSENGHSLFLVKRLQTCEDESSKPIFKKSGCHAKGKRRFEGRLEKETVTDLKNQKETLKVIQSYINGSFRLRHSQQKQRKTANPSTCANDNTSNLYSKTLATGKKKF